MDLSTYFTIQKKLHNRADKLNKSPMPAIRKRKKRRLSKRDWIAAAMEVLFREGDTRLNINHLCQALGVTKGSFYAHFEDRADFVRQFVDYWKEDTQIVVDTMDQLSDKPPEDRLLQIMRMIHTKQLNRYDVAVRGWATHDASVARGVEEVDRIRFNYIRGIFHEMGFRGTELDLRTRLFVVYQSSYEAMRLPPSELDAEEEIKLRHAFLTSA